MQSKCNASRPRNVLQDMFVDPETRKILEASGHVCKIQNNYLQGFVKFKKLNSMFTLISL